MKNKNQKIESLKQDLIKYSKQIGVVDCEIPELVFFGEEFRQKADPGTSRHGIKPSRRGGRYTGFQGLCDYYTRIILVNIRGGNKTLIKLRHTLVHELVHYRFNYLSHGDKFEERIKLILRGKEYPVKQISYPQGLPSSTC